MLENKPPKIVSLGVLNVDFVMELGSERIGKKKMGKQISINAGGHGSSQAIAAVRSGVPTAVVGKIGKDAFGLQIQTTLQEEHVNCSFLTRVEDDHSGLATIIVEEGQDNVFIDFLGSNFKLTKQDIDQCREVITQAELSMIHMSPAAMDVFMYMVEVSNQCGTQVLLTPSASLEIPWELLGRVDYLVMNMAQAASLCNLKGENAKTARIAASMLSGRVKKAVVIHMDGGGVLVAENGISTTLDTATDYKIVDPSGTTAFFTGVFGAELVKGKTVQEAAIKAHRAAMFCMAKVGVYASFPSSEYLAGL